MSSASNDNGRAYEYAFLLSLKKEIGKQRTAKIEENSSYKAALDAWSKTPHALHSTLKTSADAAIKRIFDLEPCVTENSDDALFLRIQPDVAGKEGDARDILLVRPEICWEIGLSLKHKNFSAKHCRLAKNRDFGESWYGHACSHQYWQEVKALFLFLEKEQENKREWKDVPRKAETVYVPLLRAFVSEIDRANQKYRDIPQKLTEYIIGKFDFYKVISLDEKRLTQIQAFNFKGTLNKPSKKKKPTIIVPVIKLPSRIIKTELRPASSTTVDIYMNNGWQFSFRIHSAETMVKPSLKFDVKVTGMPSEIALIPCFWA